MTIHFPSIKKLEKEQFYMGDPVFLHVNLDIKDCLWWGKKNAFKFSSYELVKEYRTEIVT